MTDIVSPSTMAQMPPAPQPTDTRTVFSARAYAQSAALSGFVSDANALADNVHQNAVAAQERAQAADVSALAAQTARTQAQAAATTAISAPGSSSTSSTELVLGAGVKTIATQGGKAWAAGQSVVVARTADPTAFRMFGTVQSYDVATGNLVVLVPAVTSEVIGGGAYSAWTISLTAPRTGMATVEAVQQAAPPGQVGFFASSWTPVGWLKCNGAAVSRTAYARLFAAIGTFYGTGDGSTTFNLPDMRGLFPRALDDGRGLDPSRDLGNYQESQNRWHSHPAGDAGHAHTAWTDSQGSHSHPVNDPGHAHPYSGGSDLLSGGGGVPRAITTALTTGASVTGIWLSANGAHGHNVGIGTGYASITVGGDGGDEARPRNMSLLACIKY